ncbi:hypothetical protein EXIGLDRAFT_842917 [Exidia glandulosa HHB12029]|uniref:Uncharacterized protein n=1 Tax=Exidia glandulosa HHB12029 TaxID=1314781 RepID=A0A165CZ89_EXIGL|nr:hypothetical protein EXIGLDRAFT_842917 [Exidia glandulosa HHB12029]
MRLRRFPKAAVWDSIKTILEWTAQSADACPQLKSAVGFALYLIKRCEEVATVRQDFRDFAKLLEDFAKILLHALTEGKYGLRRPGLGHPPQQAVAPQSDSDSDHSAQSAMPAEVQRTLEEIHEILKETRVFFQQHTMKPKKNRFKRFFSKDRDSSRLKDLERRFRESLDKFKLQTQLGDSRKIRQTQRHVRKINNAQKKNTHVLRDLAKRLSRAIEVNVNRHISVQPASRAERLSRAPIEEIRRIWAEEADRRQMDMQIYRQEQQRVMDQITAANRAWEEKRRLEREADKNEMDHVKQELNQLRQWVTATESQEVKDFGAFYKLLEATAMQVASIHNTQAERDTANREMKDLLSNVSKRIEETSDLAQEHRKQNNANDPLRSTGPTARGRESNTVHGPLRRQTQPPISTNRVRSL